MFLSKYGVARHIYVPMVKRAVADFAVGADWTPSAGDVKISKDGGAFANVTNLPTVIASANTGAVWDFSLTATEMQAAQVTVVISDAATKAVEDQSFIIQTFGNASAQMPLDLGTATINPGAAGITSASFAAGAINAAAIATDAVDADALATDGITEIAAGVLGATLAELAAVPGASPTLAQAVEFLFMALRNKLTTTTTQTKISNDAGAAIATATVTDDGTTFTRNEYA